MEQIYQNNVIEFILGDVASIKEGLKKYQMLLQNDMVISDHEMDVLFAYKEDGVLKPLQIHHGDEQIIKKLDSIWGEAGYTCGEQDFSDITSEGIFFSHALNFPELLDEVVATTKEIVNYSRRHNDTWEMWANDMCVFGIDPVFLLAQKHPEYTYLLGAYIIPYWDTEHADYVMQYLYYINSERGFDDEVMKTFCYCDNSEGRDALLNNSWEHGNEDTFDLDKFFKENPEKYELFKAMMKERFKNQKYIQYSTSDYTDKPLENFYGSILFSSSHRDEDAYDYEDLDMETMFIRDTYENEAFKLQKEIEEYIGEPLTDPYKDPYEDDKDDSEADGMWEDFFINGFENGEEIWNYILYGEDDSILEEIEPVNIVSLCKEKDLPLGHRIEWFVGEYDSFEGEFNSIFESFIEEYYEEPDSDFITKINGVDPTGRDTVIRALDVLYILMNKQAFSHDLFDDVIAYKIMKPNQFYKRYDENCGSFIGGLSYLFSGAIFTPDKNYSFNLERIYAFLNQNRKEALSLLNGTALENDINLELVQKHLSKDSVNHSIQVGLLKKGLLNYPNYFSVASYILYKDYSKQFGDELTQFLMDFIENNWLDAFINALKAESKLTDDDLSLIRKHIFGKPMPPKELMMKAMMQGIDSLTEEEKQLLNPKADSVNFEEVLPLLKEKLEQEIDEDDPQIQYDILDSFDDDNMLKMVPSLFISSFIVPMPSCPSMKRALKLLATLAPTRIIKTVAYTYNNISSTKELDYDGLSGIKRNMATLKIDKSYILAVEIMLAEDERYDNFVTMYIEDEQDTGFCMIKSLSRSEIDAALAHLSLRDKTRFYDAVAEEDDSILGAVEEKMFFQSINSFVHDNLSYQSREDKEKIEKISNDFISYIEGELSKSDIEYMREEFRNISCDYEFIRGLWRIESEPRTRILIFLVAFGFDGIRAGYNSDEIDCEDYVEILTELGVENELICRFIIHESDEDAFCAFAEKQNPYEFVKLLNTEDRIESLELSAGEPSLIGFIADMTNDSSIKIRQKADDMLSQFDEYELEENKDMLKECFARSDDFGKEILNKHLNI